MKFFDDLYIYTKKFIILIYCQCEYIFNYYYNKYKEITLYTFYMRIK